MKLSSALKIGGPLIGVIAGLIMITPKPILVIGLVIIGVTAFFAGTYFKKQGK
jgi:ammonia channel protein AmtB